MIGTRLGIYGSQTAAAVGLLLDDYPATAAYSLRKLRTAYSGSAIRVRRSSDNAEQDIGFSGNDLDTASLLTFVGAGDGFVTTWYDQQGSNNATQSTASSQPQIVSSGTISTSNSKPAIQGTSTALLQTASINMSVSARAYFMVTERIGASAGSYHNLIAQSSTPFYQLYVTNSDNEIKYYSGTARDTNTLFLNRQQLITVNQDATNLFIYQDGGQIYNVTAGASSLNAPFRLLGYSASSLNGYAQEAIIYNSDESSNKTAIETNINNYYQIYWDGSQTGLLDDYPNAAAAYSVRALNSAYTGSLIRVRRSSDNAELDIYAKYDGTLDEAALLDFVGANDAFVTTWYDQSGNGNDATNTTAANQPQIVSSGVIVTSNGSTGLDFNTTSADKALEITTRVNINSAFFVYNPNQFNTINYILGDDSTLGGTNSGIFIGGTYGSAQGLTSWDGTTFRALANAETISSMQLGSYAYNGTNSFFSYQGGSLTDVGTNNQISSKVLGGRRLDFSSVDAIVNEVIIYNTDQTSNNTDIRTNINNYYSIYP